MEERNAIRLNRSGSKAATEVFARSFFDYPLIACIIPDLDHRERYLPWYLGCMLQYGFRYGEVYTTSDIAGVSIWLPPGQTTCTTWRYIRSGFIHMPFVAGLKHYHIATKCDDQLIKVHQETMPSPHWYLWAIAVDPSRQRRGIGTSLMQPGLEKAKAQNLPCYLETHDEKDVSFYQKRGFSVVRMEQVPDVDLRFWCMVCEPGKKNT